MNGLIPDGVKFLALFYIVELMAAMAVLLRQLLGIRNRLVRPYYLYFAHAFRLIFLT